MIQLENQWVLLNEQHRWLVMQFSVCCCDKLVCKAINRKCDVQWWMTVVLKGGVYIFQSSSLRPSALHLACLIPLACDIWCMDRNTCLFTCVSAVASIVWAALVPEIVCMFMTVAVHVHTHVFMYLALMIIWTLLNMKDAGVALRD